MDIFINQITTTETNQYFIQEILDSIPKIQREVFILKNYCKKSTKDICKVYNINEKQFWAYIQNTRVRLMESMQ